MVTYLCRSLLAFLAAAALLLWLLARRPPPTSTTPGFTQRLVAVGDLHGDIANTRAVLRMAGLLDGHDTWAGGSAILVQVGDVADRGPDAFGIYHLLASLRAQAPREGGKVITLLGNHELLNALGDWRDVPAADIAAAGGVSARRAALSPHGWLGAEWAANWTFAARVPLAPYPDAPAWAFSHAGLRPGFPHLVPFPARINELGAALLDKVLRAAVPPFPPNSPQEVDLGEERAVLDARGPLWSRALADGPESTVCRWAEEVGGKIGARRMISGHTPRLDRIVSRCAGRVLIVDTGISRAFGGTLSVLEVVYTLIPASGGRTLSAADVASAVGSGEVFRERERVVAVYPRGREVIADEERVVTL